MRRTKDSGFTIIETMLFLSITGLMMAGFMFGSSRSINSQRYKDSVNSFQAIIQQQYSDVSNTINNRGNTWECSSDGILTGVLAGDGKGQSNCVILGKLIRTVGPDGKKIKINDVIGSIPLTASGKEAPTTGLDDINIFKKDNGVGLPKGYGVYLSTINEQEYDISWGASLSDQAGAPLEFSILIARSPISGSIRSFYTGTSVPDSDISGVILGVLDSEKIICVNSNDLFFGKPIAIKIVAGASNASGVEVLAESDSGCQ